MFLLSLFYNATVILKIYRFVRIFRNAKHCQESKEMLYEEICIIMFFMNFTNYNTYVQPDMTI